MMLKAHLLIAHHVKPMITSAVRVQGPGKTFGNPHIAFRKRRNALSLGISVGRVGLEPTTDGL
jgi:hypothetical protein